MTLVPLSSQADAKKAIEHNYANRASARFSSESDTSDDDNEHAVHEQALNTEDDDPTIPHTPNISAEPTGQEAIQKSSSVVQDVISRKGQYGRFAEKWFSKKGWSVEKRRMQGMSEADTKEVGNNSRKASVSEHPMASESSTESSTVDSRKRDQLQGTTELQPGHSNVADSLIPKMLRTTRMLLSSHSFYFSYDYDITRRLGTNHTTSSDIPLHKTVDPLVGQTSIITSVY